MKGRHFRRIWLLGTVLVAIGVLVAGYVRSRKPPEPSFKGLIEAGQALEQNRHADALQLAQSYLELVPESSAARYIAAQAGEKLGRKEEALALLEKIPETDVSDAAMDAAILAGSLYLEQGRARAAELRYRHVLDSRPHDVMANRKLVFLLTVEGRRWESRPYLVELISQQQHSLEELQILGLLWHDYELLPELERFRKAQPDDPLPLLGLARYAANHREVPQARDMLRKVIKAYPDLVEAYAWLGWTLVQDGEGVASLAAWEASLPPHAPDHPMVWAVRGMGAERLGQKEAAIRCYWEALQRDPNYEVAAFHLSRTLAAINQVDAANALRRRADLLYELVTILKDMHQQKKTAIPIARKIAEGTKTLGRLREAWAWRLFIAGQDPRQAWAATEAAQLEERLQAGNFLAFAAAEPELKLDVSRYPLPKWPDSVRRVAGNESLDSSAVRFVDSAAEAGIDFTYYTGDLPGEARNVGMNGGGAGILDYDGDLWPDIYFTQGCEWPVDSNQTTYRDRLFRNMGNGKYEDVTVAAGLGDSSFSHGVTVGDYDNDGFPDLYLANCGVNRLYHNNGDGTFSDVSTQAGITLNEWTCSCLMVDLNGDTFPDLFDVNYLAGDALTRRCIPGPCGPQLFPGQQDRLLLSSGDGTFRDITEQAGINGKNGKGLGIVAADFALTGKLSLFVANDISPNFLYDNVTPPGHPIPRFAENGVLSGLAYDGNGVATASMGVAADDATGDGFIELYITNFYEETNTLYIPEVPGKTYVDQAADFGLREGSKKMLGFGTQFIDGELDGWPDLIVTNGHVFDHSSKGVPFKMRAQYYRNLAGKGFAEVPADSLGPFFSQKFVGRGLARLDWNRDGREDAAISHNSSPAALLTNQTSPAGHFLALQLRGTVGSRDAIGTVARLKIGSRTITRQLTAGDGYQASNQRQLVFGLGSVDRIDQLEIRWLGGATQIFTDLAPDAEYVAVEGRETLVKLIPSGGQ